MSRHLVHQGLRPGPAQHIGQFGPAIDRLQNAPGFAADEAADPGGLSSNVNNALTVQRNREAAQLAGQPTRALGGPLPDMAWDSFFGALQKKAATAASNNMGFRADIAGHGPGTGIGQLGFINSQGLTEHPLQTTNFPSVQGMRAAADRLNRYPNRRF